MERLVSSNGAPDLAKWEIAVTAYLKKVQRHAPPRGTLQRIEAARASNATIPGAPTVVDLYVDPICPYTWIASCWLREVGRLRAIDVRHHVMSLHLLNAGGVLEKRYAGMVGPSRVAMAVVQQHGREAFATWHREFGHRIFDHWRFPTPREYRAAALDALVATGLPAALAEVAVSDAYDDALRASTDAAILPVGFDVGTPVVHIDGVAFFGPILNAVPMGDAAVRLFDGIRLVSESQDFFEFKRSRIAPPDVWYAPQERYDEGVRT
ncbi:disulfide bond formation protein DsbA [Knoellia sinensis]|nr:disulfide bond formation protein DsbA [Knoellia sinensis]